MKNLSVSIKGTYESCERRRLFVYLENADMPNIDNVPCYAGEHLRDAIQQVFQLADFFELERPNLDHLISDRLFSKEEINSAIEDVKGMIKMFERNKQMRIEMKKEKENKTQSTSK